MIRVCALTAGAHVPSARFRVGQFEGRLESFGVSIVHKPARVRAYPPSGVWRRPGWLVSSVAARIPDVVATHAYDVTLLQRELVSTMGTLERWTGRPRVLDVDDAIWLHGRFGFVPRLARACDAVICGNAHLADYFAEYCLQVFTVPTAVDTDRFVPAPAVDRERIVLGWSGSHASFHYFDPIEDGLARVLAERQQAVLRIVADRPPRFRLIPPDRVEFVQWSPDTEVEAIQTMDVGLMPLARTPWELGKCSYKMLLYLACGVPAVVSPVGMNAQVLGEGHVALAAETSRDWVEALTFLVDDASARKTLGQAGRALVQTRYSCDAIAPQLAGILRGAANPGAAS